MSWPLAKHIKKAETVFRALPIFLSLLFLSLQLLNVNLTFYLSSSYQTLLSGCAGQRDKDPWMERDFTMSELLVLVPAVLGSILGALNLLSPHLSLAPTSFQFTVPSLLFS